MDDATTALLAFVTLQRFVEFIWDWQNTQRLRRCRWYRVRRIALPGDGPGARGPVESGPYHLMRHPTCVIAAGELALVPLALDMPIYALAFLALYAAAAYLRIQSREFGPGLGARRTPWRSNIILKMKAPARGGRFH